jgi:acyl-CoA synthetase (AMP-forming)/AMP-acid ligase II
MPLADYGFRAVRLPLQNQAEMLAVLARRGMVRPIRPDRLVRVGLALHRWGSTPAGAFTVNAITRPTQPALIDDGGPVTYAEVDARTNALARGFAAAGLEPGGRIGILCRNGVGFVETMVAASKLGADSLMLNTSMAASELKAVLERERPRIVVHDGEFSEAVHEAASGTIARVVADSSAGDSSARTLAQLRERELDEPLHPPAEEGRTVILTSGTTAAPKGARVRRAENLEPLAWFLSKVPIDAGSVCLVPAPLFHAHGLGQFIICAALGCTIALPSRFDAEETLALIERHQVEVLTVVPTMLKRITELAPDVRARYEPSSLRVVVCSGSALDGRLAREFMDAFGPVLYNLYGSTEVAWATIADPRDLREAPGTVGRPPPHTRLEILDDDGRPLPPGRTGHIFVAHEMLFEGYTDPSQTRRLVDGMMTPGDLGHLDSDGRLFVDSREDDMIVSGGENVYPGQVEEVLRAHPDVDDAVVIGVEDERFGQRLVAYVVPRPGSGLSDEDVMSFSREHLARFKVPREVHLREDLPRNVLGKVLRRELRPIG